MNRASIIQPAIKLPGVGQGRPQPLLPAWSDPQAWRLLTATGSMTRLLAELWSGPVQVQPLAETTGLPTALEAACLQQPERGGWWCREILLHAGGRPRLFARTVIPPTSTQLQSAVRQLRATPLMTLLFQGNRLRPDVHRRRRWFGHDSTGHWWRQTHYQVRGAPLLLLEMLLADTCERG